MTAFFGSLGSSSPNAFPTIFSYCPTPGHEYPPNVGDSFAVIWIFLTFACAGKTNTVQTKMTCATIPIRKGHPLGCSSNFLAEVYCEGRCLVQFLNLSNVKCRDVRCQMNLIQWPSDQMIRSVGH